MQGQILGGYVTNSVLTNSYVPYSGATKSVNLGSQILKTTGASTLGSLYVPGEITATGVITSPTLAGGTATNSRINYLATTGNGTSTAIGHRFMVGNNGAITPFDIYNDGNMVLGSSIFRNYATSGANTNFLFSPPNETAQTASTEKNTFVLNANTIEFATGAKTTQRTALFSGGTLTAVGASTITNAYNGYFKANTAGTNISISSNWALGIEGGYAQIGSSETFFVRGTGLAQSWNRNPNTGGMSATAGGYQWNHTQNAAGASDFLTLATYSANGSSTQNNAFSVNSLGNVGIGAAAVNGTALTVGGAVSVTKLVGSSTAPTIARGSGLGTGASTVVSVTNATDLSGIIGVVTGTTALGTSTTLATVTFNTPYTTAPNVVIYPANAAAMNLVKGTEVYPTSTASVMTINTNTAALSSGTTYSWTYHVIQ